jgi:hypothetical protein
MMQRKILLLAVFCAALSPLCAQTDEPAPGPAVAGRIDWALGVISLEITAAIDPAIASLERAKGDAETDLEARLPDLLARAVSGVRVDSSHTLGELMAADAELYARVNGLAREARRTELFLSLDQSRLVARYLVPFFGSQGIVQPLLPSRASPIPRRLAEVTTRPYTGLLIYAKGPLPTPGSRQPANARPALFPRIWDDEMNLVLDRGMCSPEGLARWGMAGCTADVDDPALIARVGALPLRCAARGVFGDFPTDVVISTDAARQLLAIPENIALLREGKICIVYDSVKE